jgi:hypothetical protein
MLRNSGQGLILPQIQFVRHRCSCAAAGIAPI